MDYRIKLAKRMLFNKRGSLIGAILAVTVGILVIHVNFVIFQGLYDAFVRDIRDYTTGDVIVTDEFDFIDKLLINLISLLFDGLNAFQMFKPQLRGYLQHLK